MASMNPLYFPYLYYGLSTHTTTPLDTTRLNPGPGNAPDDREMAFTGRLGEG